MLNVNDIPMTSIRRGSKTLITANWTNTSKPRRDVIRTVLTSYILVTKGPNALGAEHKLFLFVCLFVGVFVCLFFCCTSAGHISNNFTSL